MTFVIFSPLGKVPLEASAQPESQASGIPLASLKPLGYFRPNLLPRGSIPVSNSSLIHLNFSFFSQGPSCSSIWSCVSHSALGTVVIPIDVFPYYKFHIPPAHLSYQSRTTSSSPALKSFLYPIPFYAESLL